MSQNCDLGYRHEAAMIVEILQCVTPQPGRTLLYRADDGDLIEES